MAPADWVPGYLPGMVAEVAPQEMVDELTALMCNAHPAANVTGLRAMAEADLRDVLPDIMVPTLLLYGELDRRSPVSVGEELHARIAGSTLVILPRLDHLCSIEGADQSNREVRAFFRDHQL
jgi:pimeloyl-ACP methyl ester carboxylesterase